jgi:hypothetical protein
MKVSKDCIDEAIRGLKDFSSEELKQYAFDVFEKAKTYQGMSNMRAFDQAMKEINDSRLKSYFESAMTAANNTMKIQDNINRIKSGKADVQTLLVKRHENQAHNVAAAQAAARETLEGSFFNKVDREQTEFLVSGKNDLMIADAYDGKKVSDPTAKVIADLWKNVYFPERNSELIVSNAMPFEHINEDRSFRNVHDSNKMILGGRSAINVARGEEKFDASLAKKKWVETVKKHFDLVHSDAVDIDGNIDIGKMDKIIGEMYDNITTGKSDIMVRSLVANDRVAIQNRSRRRLQPKSMRDFVEYNNEYGQGNLINAMLIDMQSSSNKIGMARILGDSPHAAYLDMKKAQQEFNPKKESWWKKADLYFQDVMGMNKTAVDPKLAAFDANSRAVTAMARLPLVTLDSIPDINNMATFAMQHGFNYFEAWGHHIRNIFNLYPSEDRKLIAKAYASMFQQHLGYMARYGETSNISERMNKISTGFFKTNLLHAFDNGNKLSGMEIVARGLGRNSNKSFEKLPLATQNWISKFMEPHEWEGLRAKTSGKLFTVDNVNALSEKELRAMYEAGSQLRPYSEYRNDLYRQVHAMSQIAAENMVLNPGAFERATLLRGTKPGTPEGVLLRQLAHFKTFTLAYVDKVLINGYRKADANQQKLAWATAQFIGAIPLAYGMMLFKNLAMGKSMPDPTEMSMAEKEKFLLQLVAPGLALFSGVLDSRGKNADMIWSLIASPSLRLIGNALGVFKDLATHPEKVPKDIKDTLSYILPIKTTPILSPILNEAMGEKGYLEPGQQHIFGR